MRCAILAVVLVATGASAQFFQGFGFDQALTQGFQQGANNGWGIGSSVNTGSGASVGSGVGVGSGIGVNNADGFNGFGSGAGRIVDAEALTEGEQQGQNWGSGIGSSVNTGSGASVGQGIGVGKGIGVNNGLGINRIHSLFPRYFVPGISHSDAEAFTEGDQLGGNWGTGIGSSVNTGSGASVGQGVGVGSGIGVNNGQGFNGFGFEQNFLPFGPSPFASPFGGSSWGAGRIHDASTKKKKCKYAYMGRCIK